MLRSLSVLALPLLFSACNDNDTSRTGRPIQNADETIPVVVNFAGLDEIFEANGLHIIEGRIGIGNVWFQECEGVLTAEPQFPGPFLLNVVSDTSSPPSEAMAVFPDHYCSVEAELTPDADAPGSLYFIGHRHMPNGQQIDFRIESDEVASFVLQSDEGFLVDDIDSAFVFAFDLVSMLDDVDLAAAIPSPDGLVRIDSSHNPEMLSLVVENILRSAVLYLDPDQNGYIDDTETGIENVLAVSTY
jgi:hypothetical protein